MPQDFTRVHPSNNSVWSSGLNLAFATMDVTPTLVIFVFDKFKYERYRNSIE